MQDNYKETRAKTPHNMKTIKPLEVKIGNYRIEEVSAPFGYVVNDKYINISVDTDTAFETDGDTNDARVIMMQQRNKPVWSKTVL